MSEHPIESLMGVTMQKIREMVDVNTIIGDPITTPDGTVIVPVSQVSYGFASGGSDFPSKKDGRDCFGGGSGAGIKITPVGFLTVCKGEVRMIRLLKVKVLLIRLWILFLRLSTKSVVSLRKIKRKIKTTVQHLKLQLMIMK